MHTLLTDIEAVVTYKPLPGEVDFSPYFLLPDDFLTYVIEPRATLDPFEEAKAAQELVAGRRTAILLPGRRIDALGTRHGQGGGWYDRFLAEVPEEWLRIGLCFRDQFSSEPLSRESWDQPVDHVIIVDREDASHAICETRARL